MGRMAKPEFTSSVVVRPLPEQSDPGNGEHAFAYTITIRNAGPSYGTNLVMTDTFPNVGNSARFSYQGGLTATAAGTASGWIS